MDRRLRQIVWFLLLAAGLFWKYAPTTTLAALGLVRPLDSSIHVRATGKLHVGNLRFADAATAPSRGASYDPGETVRFEYSAAGNSTTPDGSARILVDVFVKDSTGATVSGHLTQTSDIKNGTLGIERLSLKFPPQDWLWMATTPSTLIFAI